MHSLEGEREARHGAGREERGRFSRGGTQFFKPFIHSLIYRFRLRVRAG
jgi:hypothetical protein